jgi:hypothetical protein
MRLTRLIALYILALGAAEAVTAFASQLGGVVLHMALLTVLVILAIKVRDDRSHRLLLALGLAPLTRILSLSMPLSEIADVYWYIIVSVPLLVGVFAVIRVLDLSPEDIGLSARALPLQGAIGLSGLVLGLVDYFILEPDALIPALNWREIIVPTIIFILATGLAEELAFRGVMQHAATEVLTKWGWIVVAVVYGLLQMGHGSVLHGFFAFGVALLFGWIVKRTGSIMGVSMSHGLANVGLYLLYPFAFT